MQANSALQALAEGDMRELSWQLLMSFDKTYLPSVTFFKVGDSGSQIGGADLIPGANSVVQEWDKYQYTDFSSRVVRIDGFTREVEQVSSVSGAYGDIVLNNFDDYFTPGAGSPIDQYLIPGRPLRLYLGFGDQLIPYFVGLTTNAPVVDERAKTVSLHCIDFFQSLWERPLNTMALATNVRTDEAVEDVLVSAGLLSSQLVLDQGYNLLNYFAVNKGEKVIDVLKRLMEAEQGRLYMDEQGVIRFKNRQNYDSDPVMRFDAYRNIISASRTSEDSIVNVVEISSELKTLQDNRQIYDSSTAVEVPGLSSVEIWADFSDPVFTVDVPVYIDSALTSLFSVNTLEDGSGTADSTSVTLTADDQFSTSYRMTFTNSHSVSRWITAVTLYGEPYVLTDNIYVREADSGSVGLYDERVLSINNNFFQNQSEAESKALTLLDDYSSFAAVQELEVKGTPALQLDDSIEIDIFGRRQTAKITRIQVSMAKNQFSQTLRLKVFNPRSYFRVGDGGSQIGGSDYIGF